MEENLNKPRYIILLRKIWPTVYRAINTIVYFIMHIIKSTIKSAIDQIKGSF
jgi:hypothetical protein